MPNISSVLQDHYNVCLKYDILSAYVFYLPSALHEAYGNWGLFTQLSAWVTQHANCAKWLLPYIDENHQMVSSWWNTYDKQLKAYEECAKELITMTFMITNVLMLNNCLQLLPL